MEKKVKQAITILQNYLKQKLNSVNNSAVFVSGVVDSSVIAKLVYHINPKVEFLSLATDKSKDLPYLRVLQSHLNKQIKIIKPNPTAITQASKKLKPVLKKHNIQPLRLHLPIAIGFYFLCSKAKKLSLNQAVTGQGPDVLLAGYSRYNNITAKDLNQKILQDLTLLDLDKLRDTLTAQIFGIDLINPYLSNEFVSFCLKLEPKFKKDNKTKQNKILIRLIARQLNLPKEIWQRKKSALQYSTGLIKKLKIMELK